MSQLTAETLIPLISALPESEKYALQEKLEQMLPKKGQIKKKRSSVLDLPHMAKYRPENKEAFVAAIMNGLDY